MAGSLYKAADDILSLANKFKPLFTAADELKKLGDLDRLSHELMKKKEAAEQEANKAQQSADKVLSELNGIEKAKVEAEESINKSLRDAAANADKIVQDATHRAEKIIKEANSKKSEANEVYKMAKQDAEKMEKIVSEKKSQLDELNRKVKDIRSNISVFMRGQL